MRRVTRQAALIRLHRRMFEDEGPHRIGVAFGADCELSCRCANLMSGLGAMRVVTIAALNQSHLDAVPVRPSKLGLLRSVAPEAKVLLRFNQHEIHIGGFVRTMASGATDAVRHMLRLGEVLRLQAGLMALGADGGRLRRT